MIKVKFIGDNPLEYALFKDKVYTPYHESEDNYLIHNEAGSNSIVPRALFVEAEDKTTCHYCQRQEVDALVSIPHHEGDEDGESMLFVYDAGPMQGHMDLWVMDINEDVLRWTETFKIDYCPMCGRMLKTKEAT